jgi:uncharacterized membrane protein YidH (DUF202 family)
MAHDLPKTGADGAPLPVVPSEHDLEKQKEKAEKEARDFAKEQITYERARIAIEKMQLSWLRKTMIISALGMTLYKVFEAEVGPGGGLVLGFLTAREIGLFMLLVGFVSLVFATRQYVKAHNKIKVEYEKYQPMPPSLSLYLSYAILFIALFLFLATLSRYGSGLFTATK